MVRFLAEAHIERLNASLGGSRKVKEHNMHRSILDVV
jgi:hypothetical protein